jgi:FMN phosphatase YigB (HAD superfamily)
VAVIVFGLEHSPDDPPGTHPRVSLRDLEAAHTVAGFLARRSPRKRVLTVPASAAGWQRLLPPDADLIVIGGGVSNVEFARHRELYQRWFRLKMGRLCRLDGQRVLHVDFGRLPPGQKPPPRLLPEAIDRFPSESVSRDFALIFSKRRQVYGALRRVIGIAGVKGNGTRAAALYLTQSGTVEDGPDAVLPRLLGAEDELELAVAVDVVLDVVDRIEPLEVVLNGERIFARAGQLGGPCELGRPCAGCSFGEELGLAGTGPRAIIFDLDDTLTDTFSLLIEPLEREAAVRMAEAGAGGWDAGELAAILLRLRREKPERLEEELAGLVSGAAMEARRSVLAAVPAERLRLDPDVRALLMDLRRDSSLVLLTEGDPDLQNRKIDHLMLRDLFDEVIIVPSGTEPAKEEAIANLLVHRGLAPDSAVIVGNRLDREILAGERLRLTTVWLRRGEGSGHIPGEAARPDYIIESLGELSAALGGWAGRSGMPQVSERAEGRST